MSYLEQRRFEVWTLVCFIFLIPIAIAVLFVILLVVLDYRATVQNRVGTGALASQSELATALDACGVTDATIRKAGLFIPGMGWAWHGYQQSENYSEKIKCLDSGLRKRHRTATIYGDDDG